MQISFLDQTISSLKCRRHWPLPSTVRGTWLMHFNPLVLHTVSLLVSFLFPVPPPERRGPGTPSAWPPQQSSSWGWAATDHRTHRMCWSRGSTRSSAASSSAGLRTGLREWRKESSVGCPHWIYNAESDGSTRLESSSHRLFCCHLSPSASSTWPLPPPKS